MEGTEVELGFSYNQESNPVIPGLGILTSVTPFTPQENADDAESNMPPTVQDNTQVPAVDNDYATFTRVLLERHNIDDPNTIEKIKHIDLAKYDDAILTAQMAKSPEYQMYRDLPSLENSDPINILRMKFMADLRKDPVGYHESEMEYLWDKKAAERGYYEDRPNERPQVQDGEAFDRWVSLQKDMEEGVSYLAKIKSDFETKFAIAQSPTQADYDAVFTPWNAEVTQHIGAGLSFQIGETGESLTIGQVPTEEVQQVADWTSIEERWGINPDGKIPWPTKSKVVAEDMYLIRNQRAILARAYEQGRQKERQDTLNEQRNPGIPAPISPNSSTAQSNYVGRAAVGDLGQIITVTKLN